MKKDVCKPGREVGINGWMEILMPILLYLRQNKYNLLLCLSSKLI
jgi:hypothetical protein